MILFVIVSMPVAAKADEDADITADPASMNGCKIGVLDSAMYDVLNRYLEDNNVTAEVITYV